MGHLQGVNALHFISWASLVAQTVKNPPAMKETWFNPWIGKIPWRREHPLEEKGTATHSRGCKESDMTE